MALNREIVERRSLDPLGLAPVRGALAGLELIEHLTLLAGASQRGTIADELALTLLEVDDRIAARALEVLDEGLAGEQIGAGRTTARRLTTDGLEPPFGDTQQRHAVGASRQAGGELLLGLLLGVLAQLANALKTEMEARSHLRRIVRREPDPVLGAWTRIGA